MKLFYLYIICAFLIACDLIEPSDDGGISGTGEGRNGSAIKGPLIAGSIISAQKLKQGSPSGSVIEDKTISNKGNFNIELEDAIYSIQAQGRYYEETTGTYSTGEAELKAIIDASLFDSNTRFSINVLTDISYDYTLELLQAGNSYVNAKQNAQTRTLNTLSALTGIDSSSQDFELIQLSNDGAGGQQDWELLIYLSSLLVQTQLDNRHLDINEMLDDLSNAVTNNTNIEEETLNALLASHDNIDPSLVAQNIDFILDTTGSVDLTPLITELDVTNPALAQATYALAPLGNFHRFFYDGAFDSGGGNTGGGNILAPGEGNYHIQISDFADFSSLDINDQPRSNTYDVPVANWAGPVTKYIRVRRVSDSGQVGQWSTALMVNIL